MVQVFQDPSPGSGSRPVTVQMLQMQKFVKIIPNSARKIQNYKIKKNRQKIQKVQSDEKLILQNNW